MPIEQSIGYITQYLPSNCQIAVALNQVWNLDNLEITIDRLQALESQRLKDMRNYQNQGVTIQGV